MKFTNAEIQFQDSYARLKTANTQITALGNRST